MVADQSEPLLGCLDDVQRKIATLKMARYQNSEIAETLDVSISTVERKLSLIQDVWRGDVQVSRYLGNPTAKTIRSVVDIPIGYTAFGLRHNRKSPSINSD